MKLHPWRPTRLAIVALFKQACDGDDMLGCAKLAAAYGTGRGVPKDLERAVALLAQACKGGLTLACR